MKHYFSLQGYPDKLRIDIGKTIEEYYPIGIDQDSPEYSEYPGIKKLQEILTEHINGKSKFNKLFKVLLTDLRKVSKRKIYNTTFGMIPSHSADVILDRYEDEAMIRVKKLSFAISLLGPYYSIFGIDETFIKEIDEPKAYHSINVITASPYKEFKNDFLYLKGKIEETFEGYQLVPMIVTLSFLEKIQINPSYRKEYTVYNALFNHLLDYYDHQKPLRGDWLFGLDKSKLPKFTLVPPSSLL